MNVIKLFGYSICADGLHECVAAVEKTLNMSERAIHVACANPHSLVIARDDKVFNAALLDADVLLPDGVGIVFGARFLGNPVVERVAGMEFFVEFCRRLNMKGAGRVFFLGSTDQVLEKIARRFKRDYPHLTVAGTLSPPFADTFSERETEEIIGAINAARTDILWVGMTAPKQEKWIYNNRQRLQVKMAGSIGAVFDFYAGTRVRAPQWICSLGLEWLPRLLREPLRLWRRNFVSSPHYLCLLARERLLKLLR